MSQTPSESYIQVPPDSTGKKMRSIQTTLTDASYNQNTVQEQVVRIANDEGIIIDPRDSPIGAAAYFDWGKSGWDTFNNRPYGMITKLLNDPKVNDATYWANGW